MTDQQPIEENSVKRYGYAEDVKGNDSCPTCERNGQFLPARIAVALKNDLVTPAPSELIAELPILPDGLMYILRRLNEGFIYCYSSAWRFSHYNDTEIRAYQINDLGYLTAMDKDNMPLANKGENYSCFQSKLSSKGRSISGAFFLDLLVFQSDSTKINIAYSKHQWSVETCNKMAEDNTLRQSSMIEFDLLTGGKHLKSAESCYNLLENEVYEKGELDQIIPWEKALFARMQKAPFEKAPYFEEGEYVLLRVPEKDKATGKTKVDSNGAVIWVPNTEEEYKLHPTDRVIVLQDPVGICEDILNAIDHLAQKVRTAEEERLYQSAMNLIRFKGLVKAKIHAKENYDHEAKYLEKLSNDELESLGITDSIYQLKRLTLRNMSQYSNSEPKEQTKLPESIEKYRISKVEIPYTTEQIRLINEQVEQKFKRQWEGVERFRFRERSLLGSTDGFGDHFKEQQMQIWLEQQAQKLIEYSNTQLEPLVKCYLEWLKSDLLLNYMDSFFDQETPFSATEFLKVTSRIVGNADTLELCAEYFAELLDESNYSNHKNYLLRAMTFDYSSIQSVILSTTENLGQMQVSALTFAAAQFFDEKTIDGLDSYRSRAVKISKDMQKIVDELSDQIGGTVARVIHKQVNRTSLMVPKTPLLKTVQVFSGRTYVGREFRGTLSSVTRDIANIFDLDLRAMAESQGLINREADRAIRSEQNRFNLNLQNVLKENFRSDPQFHRLGQQPAKVNTVLYFDDSKLSQITPMMSNAEQTAILRQSIFSADQVKDFEYSVGTAQKTTLLSELEQNNQDLFKRQFNGSGFGVFAWGLQGAALFGAIYSLSAAKSDNLREAQLTLAGVVTGSLGNAADMLARQVKMVGLRTGTSSKQLKFVHGGLSFTARIGLYSGAVLLASVEWMKAYDVWNKGHKLIARLYIANGVSMILSTAAFVTSHAMVLGLRTNIWGLILIGVVVAITYTIEALQYREIVKYLKGSAWGNQPAGWKIGEEETIFKNIYE